MTGSFGAGLDAGAAACAIKGIDADTVGALFGAPYRTGAEGADGDTGLAESAVLVVGHTDGEDDVVCMEGVSSK